MTRPEQLVVVGASGCGRQTLDVVAAINGGVHAGRADAAVLEREFLPLVLEASAEMGVAARQARA